MSKQKCSKARRVPENEVRKVKKKVLKFLIKIVQMPENIV